MSRRFFGPVPFLSGSSGRLSAGWREGKKTPRGSEEAVSAVRERNDRGCPYRSEGDGMYFVDVDLTDGRIEDILYDPGLAANE